jgi:hypothetical protein
MSHWLQMMLKSFPSFRRSSYFVPFSYLEDQTEKGFITNLCILSLTTMLYLDGNQEEKNVRLIMKDLLMNEKQTEPISWSTLCQFLVENSIDQLIWNLIYIFVYDCKLFMLFMIQQVNFSTFMMNLLKHIYEHIQSHSEDLDFLYLLLGILLIFSEEEFFHSRIQKMVNRDKFMIHSYVKSLMVRF